MKKLLLFLCFFLLACGFGMAQTMCSTTLSNNEGFTADVSSPLARLANPETDVMSAWVLPIAGGGSVNSRIPRNNTNRYQRTEYLITPAEMLTSGYPSGYNIDALSFSIGTAGVGTQTGDLKIYLKNTSDISYTLGSTWTTSGFTMVHANAAFTVPYAAGNYTITFSGGSPFTYTGGGVYVAWEFANVSGSLPTGSTALTANCNTTQGTMCYGYQGTTLGTALTVTAYRPATQFINNTLTDVLQVTNIYSMEKCPLPYGVPMSLSARVANVSAGAEAFNVTMTITDQVTSAVRYTNTQTVASLAGGAAVVVNFPSWTAANLENVNITVTVPTGTGETFLTNNTMVIPTNINNNLFGYCYTLNASTGYGFTYTGAGGIFANKFYMNGTGTIPGANLFIYNTAANVGNNIYAVVINSAGVIVAQSAILAIASGDLGTNKNFTFPVPPTFTNEGFYVGMAQPTGGTVQWFPMGCMPEAPYRAGAYYTFAITGGTPSPRTTDVKLMIEAQVAAAQLLANDVGTVSINMNRVVTTGNLSPKATVKNFGSNTASFSVTMTINGGYSSTQNVSNLVTGATAQVTFDPWTSSTGDFTVGVCTAMGSDQDESNDCMSQAVKAVNMNKQVYGYLAFADAGTDPVGPTTFNLAAPETLNSLADQSALTFVNGGTWANGQWYGTVYNTVAPYNFITLDPATGARTVIGNMGMYMNGLSYNPANNTMYGVSATSLYTIDMATGLPTLVGANTGINMINLAINNAGQAFSVDVTADNLGTVNLATGIFTPVGPIGFNANYAQDMEFDRETGELFMAAHDLSNGWLGWVNQSTGAVLKVNDFEGGGEVTGFAIPYMSLVPLSVNGSATNVTCYGGSNGTVTTTVSGGNFPYTYLWSNLATTASLTGVGAGSYTVTVTDAALMTATGSWTITQPEAFFLYTEILPASCPDAADGSISMAVNGGTPSYTHIWSNGSTAEDISGLAPGEYSVTVTDNAGCVTTGSWTVGILDPVCNNISVSGTASSTVCFNAHQTITVAGYTVAAPSGNATFIAGQNILFQPGTVVQSGAYMHGYISTIFCSPAKTPSAAAGLEEPQAGLSLAAFSLYPNPSSGNFTIRQKGDRDYGSVQVEIYTMSGAKVMTDRMTGERQHEFNVENLPAGIYFVKLVANGQVETIKMVRTR